MPIKVLDSKVISRIAAGEVVERPASVVKELVENSLDSGATEISVTATGGGATLLRVVDNGAGIPEAEVDLAFSRHATSKITRLEDLESSLSLGFRGEALCSIAAVAEVEFLTRAPVDEAATGLTLKDGVITDRRLLGRARGTTVAVRNLFRQVPARLKFLKTTATENSHIANIVSRYALAYPEVRFTLSLDGRVTLRTAGSGQLLDSIVEVYGPQVAQHMLPIVPQDWQTGEADLVVKVSGMVGSPQISRASRDYLILFVNRRWVSHRLLAWTVEEAYHGLLMTGKHPVAVISLAIEPAEIDINVHPAKTEVKFRDTKAVLAVVQKAVRQTLVEQVAVPNIGETPSPPRAPVTPPPLLWKEAASKAAEASSIPLTPTPAKALPVLRVVGQVLKSYIVAEGPDGLYLIDQHAAHERIIFEQVKEKRARREPEVQKLLESVTFEVSPREFEALREHHDLLGDYGFAIEPFGERTYLVRAVPATLAGADWMAMLKELVDVGDSERAEERLVMSLACHGSVRAGQALSDDEMRALVRQLEQTSLPQACPHGRPTIITLHRGQLERDFHRT